MNQTIQMVKGLRRRDGGFAHWSLNPTDLYGKKGQCGIHGFFPVVT